jgi:hypothetical protein
MLNQVALHSLLGGGAAFKVHGPGSGQGKQGNNHT